MGAKGSTLSSPRRRFVSCLAPFLLTFGCADARIFLGWNAADSGDTGAPGGPADAPADDGNAAAAVDASDGDAGPTVSAADGDAADGDATAASKVTPSCQAGGPGLTDCGPTGESCCTSLGVAAGTYFRTYKNAGGGPTGQADPASVSDFRLDKYLVTVGRFRQFVAAWQGGAGYAPPPGSGKHKHLNAGNGLNATGGGYEPGWVAANQAYVTPTDANLACDGPHIANLAVGSRYGTWTPAAGSQENLPITCENWYEAYAFCVWDGGFLPSEAELGYVQAGGSAQREFPWGAAAPGVGSAYAIYGCYYQSDSGICTGVANVAPVGTAALGAALWGQLDMAGSVWEWTLDYFASYVSPCVDCANFATAATRVTRGGNFNTAADLFPPIRHANNPADMGAYAYGFRCARAP
jgi:formylglycine-generating enzyme